MDSLFDTIDTRALRDAFGRFATGVGIVTTTDADGTPVGMTINSFSTVSLAPPMVLWSLMRTSARLPAFRAGRHFAINILAADQQDLAMRFAARVEDRFAGLGWSAGLGGVPLLDGCIARFECTRDTVVEAGDHIVLFGRVDRFERREALPLVFFASRYAGLA